MSATVIRSTEVKGGKLLILTFEGARYRFAVGTVGSFFFARINRPDVPFNAIMSMFTAIHVHLSQEGWPIGKHEAHPPCAVEGGIVKNWDIR